MMLRLCYKKRFLKNPKKRSRRNQQNSPKIQKSKRNLKIKKMKQRNKKVQKSKKN